MQVLPALSVGGAEQGCIDIHTALIAAGCHSIIVTSGGEREAEAKRAGGTIINLPVKSKNPLIILRNTTRLKNIIKNYGVDIVHARSRAPAWSCYNACKKTNARFMTTCHAPYTVSGVFKKSYNSVMAKGERIIAISQYVRNYLLRYYKIDKKRIRTIARGIPLDIYNPSRVTAERIIQLSQKWSIPEDSFVALLPGRLTRWKGHHVFIKAMAQLKRNDVVGIIVGADQGRTKYREELESLIKAHNLSDRLWIVDHCRDMTAAYRLATVVVSASIEPEGFGRVPVEAQAMGRLVVATNHGGAVETVIDGETGLLVEPGNAKEMAEAIDRILSLSEQEHEFIGEKAQKHVNDFFSKEQMIKNTFDVYNELLPPGKRKITEKKTGNTRILALNNNRKSLDATRHAA